MVTKFDEVFSVCQPCQGLYETTISRTILVLIQTPNVAYSLRKLHHTNHEASHPVFSVLLLLLFLGSNCGNVYFQKLPFITVKTELYNLHVFNFTESSTGMWDRMGNK
jgi:hypothetical protein